MLFGWDLPIHGSSIVLTDIVCYLQNFNTDSPCAKLDLKFVPYLDIIRRFGRSAVDHNTGIVAGLIGYGAPFDQARDFQILIQPHKLLGDLVLQSLASLENGNAGSGNLDGFLGSGVTAGTSFTLLGFEAAETNQLDLIAVCQSVSDGVDGSVQSLFSVLLGQAGLNGHFCDEFSLVHN